MAISVSEWMQQNPATDRGSVLLPHKSDITALRMAGYTAARILEFLEANGVRNDDGTKVTTDALYAFIKYYDIPKPEPARKRASKAKENAAKAEPQKPVVVHSQATVAPAAVPAVAPEPVEAREVPARDPDQFSEAAAQERNLHMHAKLQSRETANLV